MWVVVSAALLGGCLGSRGRPVETRSGQTSSSSTNEPTLASASAGSPVTALPSVTAAATAEPSASVPMPPGPYVKTKPCKPHQTWGETLPPPPEGYRAAKRGCGDMGPAWEFPVCTPEQVARSFPVDEAVGARSEDGKESLRGYLRRDVLSPPMVHMILYSSPPPPPTDYDRRWNLRLETQLHDGACVEVALSTLDRERSSTLPEAALCFGDASLACCHSSIIQNDIEVLVDIDHSMGSAALCTVQHVDRHPSPVTVHRNAERPPKPQRNVSTRLRQQT